MHMLRRVKELHEYTLDAVNGLVGKVNELYFDDATWTVRYLVAKASPWMPRQEVLLSPIAVKKIDDMKASVDLNLTVEQIQNSPAASTERPVSREYEEEYYHYYGWPLYWAGEERWGWGTYPMDMRLPGTGDTLHAREGDPHLRSTRETTGYSIQARDGDIGHIEDFIVHDETWALRYMVVNTRNFMPGREVLISPHWIESISWERSRISVDLMRDAIANAPEYDPRSVVTRNYEMQLFRHFGREEDMDAVFVGRKAAAGTR